MNQPDLKRPVFDFAHVSNLPIDTVDAAKDLFRFCLTMDECWQAMQRNGRECHFMPNEQELATRRRIRDEALSKGEPDPYKAQILTYGVPAYYWIAGPTDEDRERDRTRLQEAGRQWAEKREQLILDTLLKEPQAVRIMPSTCVRYFLAAENIEAGKWCCLGADGMVRVANGQAGLSKAAELATYTVGNEWQADGIDFEALKLSDCSEYSFAASASIEERYEKSTKLIHDLRMAAGCQPGESLIGWCKEIAARRRPIEEFAVSADITLNTSSDVEFVTRYCLDEHEWFSALGMNGKVVPPWASPPSKNEFDARWQKHSDALDRGRPSPFVAGVRGSLKVPEPASSPMHVVYEATLHHCGEGDGVSPESFVGKPVMNQDRTATIGRIVSAVRKGNFIVGTIEFEPGKEPQLRQADLAKLAEAMARQDDLIESRLMSTAVAKELLDTGEPQSESWRDKPPLL